MADKQQSDTNPDEPTIYQIRIKGHLGTDWEDWFGDGHIVQTDDGETLLTCTVTDQPALHAILRRIRDLGLPLISVVPVKPEDSESSNE